MEDRIRGAKATGLRNLPFWGFAANDAWLSLVCIAQTLVCWAQALLLDGDCKLAEPKTLRYRLWHTAGRIVRHARRARPLLARSRAEVAPRGYGAPVGRWRTCTSIQTVRACRIRRS